MKSISYPQRIYVMLIVLQEPIMMLSIKLARHVSHPASLASIAPTVFPVHKLRRKNTTGVVFAAKPVLISPLMWMSSAQHVIALALHAPAQLHHAKVASFLPCITCLESPVWLLAQINTLWTLIQEILVLRWQKRSFLSLTWFWEQLCSFSLFYTRFTRSHCGSLTHWLRWNPSF